MAVISTTANLWMWPQWHAREQNAFWRLNDYRQVNDWEIGLLKADCTDLISVMDKYHIFEIYFV